MTEVHKSEREATLSLKWLKQYFILAFFKYKNLFKHYKSYCKYKWSIQN